MTSDVAQMVSAHPLFSGLPRELLDTVAGCARNVAFRPGGLLLAENDPADTLYLVRRGAVAIEIHAPGRGPITIETVGPGAVVGWSWLVPPYRCHFDARASTPVGAVALDGACLRSKAENDPVLGYALMKRVATVLVERLQMTRVRLLDVYGDVHGPHA